MPLQIPQLAVTGFPNPALPGQLAFIGVPAQLFTGVLESAADAGLAVCKGAAAKVISPVGYTPVKAATVIGDVFRGVAIYDPARMPQPGGATMRYAIGDAVSYCRKGWIWVSINGDVTEDAAAYCVYTGAPGKFRADTTGAIVASVGFFRSTTTVASGLPALLELT